MASIALLLFLLFFSAPPLAHPSPLTHHSHLSHLLETHERERPPASVQEAAARGVLSRLLPSHSSSFDFQIIDKEKCGGDTCFIISNHPSFSNKGHPEILIRGVSGVELSAGLHWYLKNWCLAHISWEKTGGTQLFSVPTPGSLPHVHSAGVLIKRPVAWSYYQNAVTSSYSMAWWDWERWEKEIDWMALQGINLPLAFNGQEAIWQKVFQKFNISNSDLDDFFGGPAFLAWSRMGNMHGWGGPLPQTWLDDQLALQKKILSRMFEFGMSPVLPAFSGNVPSALKSKFPSAKITRLGNWFTVDSNPRWCCTYLLDATDPLFIDIGKAFIEQQFKEYGRTSHIYNCDTFDENTPPVDEPKYISSLGAAIFKGMQSGDTDAIWLMQVVFLVPFELCMLHNFAANIEMYGILDSIASGPIEARKSENSTMVGVGMCMEGIEQNPVVYDLMSEMAFHQKNVDVKDKNRDVIVAFPDVDPSIISLSENSEPANVNFGRQLLAQRQLKTVSDSYDQPHIWYSTVDVINALELFLASGDYVSDSNTFRYDLVDLTRQALAKYANQVFLRTIEAYQYNDLEGVTVFSQHFLGLVKDLDMLLSCHDGFLLGPWLESAKHLARDAEQEKQYEWNARTQITMWFDNTETEASLLRDYGNKYWSGLLQDYYGPRGAIYFKYLLKSLVTGHAFELENWRREWISLTNKWQMSRKVFTMEGSGDALNISRWLYDKYLRNTKL
ncbi:hypothetical protein J5N97_026653 [Dioscorea zingiberensis]|uniref:Alpha-N-acetylglucosaminidase n=1 Tax=Dioscorea zingiberensis TaxID=325984 RepID=A0A9D5C328_9LILI|nr:hypothetical protein J5N97_026653 [Dioscorea zingiberensis]